MDNTIDIRHYETWESKPATIAQYNYSAIDQIDFFSWHYELPEIGLNYLVAIFKIKWK